MDWTILVQSDIPNDDTTAPLSHKLCAVLGRPKGSKDSKPRLRRSEKTQNPWSFTVCRPLGKQKSNFRHGFSQLQHRGAEKVQTGPTEAGVNSIVLPILSELEPSACNAQFASVPTDRQFGSDCNTRIFSNNWKVSSGGKVEVSPIDVRLIFGRKAEAISLNTHSRRESHSPGLEIVKAPNQGSPGIDDISAVGRFNDPFHDDWKYWR